MSDALVAWVGGAAATLLAFVGLWPWMTRNLNHKAFGEQIKKLILAGNGERAIKLCGAAPQSPVAVAVARTLAQRGRSEDLRDVYTSTLRAGLAGAGKLVWFAGGTLAIDAVVVYLVAARGAPVAALALVALSAMAVFSAQGMVRKIATEGAQLGAELVETLGRAPDQRPV
jgi:hypothetical protein